MTRPSRSAPSPSRRWLRLPEWLTVLPVLALPVLGLLLLGRARAERVVHAAELGGLSLRLEAADWLHDGMLHPGTTPFGMPVAMMPGMPPEQVRRLNVELTVQNVGDTTQPFDLAELSLHATGGAVWVADPGPTTRVVLPPRHLYATVVQFDVPETEREPLTLRWARGGGEARLLSTVVPEHEEPPSAAPDEWPARVEELPVGRAGEGRSLYHARFACSSCHGEPGVADSNTLGPALGDFPRAATTRIPGKGAAQYAYESILNPGAFIAPECARGQPCSAPSAMPVYGELMSPQDMADVITFLMAPRITQRQ
jgi:mono/diheme cytochrome c family protein